MSAVKVTDLQVDGFGVWKGLSVESLSDDITVFCGQNEAGKTTLMQFVRSMLFGFSAERRDKYTPPVYGGLAGGSMEIDAPKGTFEIQRHVDPARVLETAGDLAVTDARTGTVHGRAQLSELLSDMDESIFNNVFAIGLREIQELGALNSTDAAEHLYKLTSGLDRVSLIDVMRDLKKRRNGIWSIDSKTESRLGELSEQRMTLMREVDELKTRGKRWSRIAAQTNDVSNQLSDIALELTGRERESRLVEIATQISERWQTRRSLGEQITSFGKLPERRDVMVEKLDDLNARIVQQKSRIDQVRKQRRSIKKEAAALPIHRRLWQEKARIEAITAHQPWVESLQRTTDRLRTDIDTIENSLVGEVDGLGTQLQIRAKDVRDLGNRGLSSLKSLAKKLLDQQERLKRMNQETEKAGFELGQHEERLGGSLNATSDVGSMEDVSRHVNRLRRRIELEDKIERLTANRHDLEREIDSVVNDQVLPVEKLSIIGIVFILGVILAGLGIFGQLGGENAITRISEHTGVLFMLLGAVSGFIAMGMKYHWERVAREELEDFRHQMDIVRQQLKRAKVERDDIERQIPESVGQWDLELKDAEARLARIEDLVPLENRVQNSRMQMDDLRRRISSQENEVEQVDRQWRAALRTAGLPELLEPLQLKEITQRSSRISGFHSRLDQYRNELVDRDKELTSLTRRIDTIFHDLGMNKGREFRTGNSTRETARREKRRAKTNGTQITRLNIDRKAQDDAIRFSETNAGTTGTGVDAGNGGVLERLSILTSALNEQRALIMSRKEMAAKHRALRSRLTKSKRELDKLLGSKRKLLSRVGAEDENDFRQFHVKHQQRQELIEKRKNLSEQISAALGTHFAESDLTEYLDAYGLTGLEKRWEEIQASIEELKERQTRLHQQRGEFLQEVKSLGEDSRMDEVRMELNAIDVEIKQLKRQWQVLASSNKMLESIRETYESKRQPETLQEASGYLDSLTGGHYKRIWTRLVGEELLVDNHEGETITVDKLSRGTREAVYLSLRLALVTAYARRGAVLPLVLDDVLVNFDARRARSAAALLCEFARNGYQILMFTCHDHMRDMFYELDANVRVLPYHRDVVENGATVVEYRAEGRIERPKPVEYVDAAQPPVEIEPVPIQIPAHVAIAAAPARRGISLSTDEYDPELEYELSAIVDDQRVENRLRHELVFVSPKHDLPIDISGNEDIWFETNASIGH